MSSFITVPRMAQVLGLADDLDADGIEALHNRLRNLARKGFLNPAVDPNATATSARIYEINELARARMLSDAIQGGIEGDALIAVSEALTAAIHPGLNHPPSAGVENGFTYGDGLASAIRGVIAGERWLLRIRGRIRPHGKTDWNAWVTWEQPTLNNSNRARDTLNLQAPTFYEATLDFKVRLTPLLPIIAG